MLRRHLLEGASNLKLKHCLTPLSACFVDSAVPPLPCEHLPLCQAPQGPWERPSEPVAILSQCPWSPREDRPPQRLWEGSRQQYTQVPAAEDMAFVPLHKVKEWRDQQSISTPQKSLPGEASVPNSDRSSQVEQQAVGGPHVPHTSVTLAET